MLRVLLVGEYSGVHTDLAAALRKKGHFVLTANAGDGYKKYSRDVDLNIDGKNKLKRVIQVLSKYYQFYKVFKNGKFDIIQFINPELFQPFFNSYLFSLIFKTKAKIVLLACGGDTLVWEAYRSGKYRYFPYDGGADSDQKKWKSTYESPKFQKHSNKVYRKADAIIPLLTEYFLAYDAYKHKTHFVPLSIDCNWTKTAHVYKTGSKIKIYHPVTKGREKEKGSDIILKALERVGKEFGSLVEVITTQSISFNEYKQKLEEVDIVVDQVYSYSPSMNALYSMSLGKVVLGGAEIEYLAQLNIESAPIINILPDVEDIYQKLVKIIESPGQIESIRNNSIEFVNRYHSIATNVDKFEKIWKNLL